MHEVSVLAKEQVADVEEAPHGSIRDCVKLEMDVFSKEVLTTPLR